MLTFKTSSESLVLLAQIISGPAIVTKFFKWSAPLIYINRTYAEDLANIFLYSQSVKSIVTLTGVQGYSGKAAATARAPPRFVRSEIPTKNSLPKTYNTLLH
jgi:hypothetical protein